jgi:hypothetical protein
MVFHEAIFRKTGTYYCAGNVWNYTRSISGAPMEFMTLAIQNVSSTSLFASRPFLVAFVVALLARWAFEANAAFELSALAAASEQLFDVSITNLQAASWLINETTLVLLGLLALGEFVANSDTDLRLWYDSTAWVSQPGSSFFVTFGLTDGQYMVFVEVLSTILPHSTLLALATMFDSGVAVASLNAAPNDFQLNEALGWLGHVVAFIWSALIGAASWGIGRLRAAFLDAFFDFDDDDSLGVQGGFSLAEYGFVAFGMWLMVFFAFAALILAGLTVLGLYLLRRYFERRERQTYVACPTCATSMHPSALACPNCRTPNREVHQIGFFGLPRTTVVNDLAAQRVRLQSQRRCPVCATRLKERTIKQPCPACNEVSFADMAAVNTYLRTLDGKVMPTAVICGLIGLIPLIGIIPGIIYYRFSLIAGLNGYIPRSVGCVTRWGTRLLSLALLALQPIPLFGALVLPAICFINYNIYRQVLIRSGESTIGRTFAPVAMQAAASTAAVAAPPPPPPVAPTTVNCPSCNNANPVNYRFCASCGAQLPGA